MQSKTNKSLLKSIQIFLVCLVVFLGGLCVNSEVEAKTYKVEASCAKAYRNARCTSSPFPYPSPNVPDCPVDFEEFHYADRDTPAVVPIPADYNSATSDVWVSSNDTRESGDCWNPWSISALSGTCPYLKSSDTATLELYNDNGIVIASASVTNGNPGGTPLKCSRFSCGYRICSAIAPTCTLTASDTSINLGDSITLDWTTAGATDVDLDGDHSISFNGSMSFTPAATTTYVLTAVNDDGESTTCSVTVDICVPDCNTSIGGCLLSDPDLGNTSVTGAECCGVGECYECDTGSWDGSACAVLPPPPPPEFVKGGLVPCGRMLNNPATSWDETAPCNFCHLVMMMQKIINFLLTIMITLALLALIITGFLFVTSAGSVERRTQAKTGLKYSIGGFIIILTCWIIIDFFLIAWGYIDPLGGEWNVVNCDITAAVPSGSGFCSDDIV